MPAAKSNRDEPPTKRRRTVETGSWPKEGEGDLSLACWRHVHRRFLTGELASISRTFGEDTPVVCEEFELVFP